MEIKKLDSKNWVATAGNGITLEFYKILPGHIATDDNIFTIERTANKSKPYAVKSNFGDDRERLIGSARTISAAIELSMLAYLETFQAASQSQSEPASPPKPKYIPDNRPKKGDRIVVDPIRKQKDVVAIKNILQGNHRDYLLFVMGINNGLRAGDLLKLKVKDVKDIKAGKSIQIKEGKTGKTNILVINKIVHAAIRKYIIEAKPDDDDYLFKSRKGANKPLTIQTVNNLVKGWCQTLKIKGNFGAHTLRKTWGYHARMYYGAGFEIICKRYNHSSPSATMRYLGIEDKEIHSLLLYEV